jgi:hypothetical protein
MTTGACRTVDEICRAIQMEFATLPDFRGTDRQLSREKTVHGSCTVIARMSSPALAESVKVAQECI